MESSIEMPKTQEMEEAQLYNIVGFKKYTKRQLSETMNSLTWKKLIKILEEIGCDDKLMKDKLVPIIKNHKEFTINLATDENIDTIYISIKYVTTNGIKIILLKKVMYYAINPKTMKKKKKYMVTII